MVLCWNMYWEIHQVDLKIQNSKKEKVISILNLNLTNEAN
jgi:hypothetical protein